MKTFSSLFIILLFCGFYSMGQGGSSVGLQAGYNFDLPLRITGTSDTDDKSENLYGSLGHGVPISLFYEFPVNDNFNLGFNAGFNLGMDEVSHEYSGNFGSDETNWNTNFITFNPYFSFPMVTFGGEDAFELRAKIGVGAVFGAKTTETYVDNFTSGGMLFTQQEEIEHKYDPGFFGTGGFELSRSITDNIDISLDAACNVGTLHRSESEYTVATQNGVDQLPFWTTSDIKTEYTNELDQNSNTSGNPGFDPNKATEELGDRYPIDAIRISLGAKYKF